MVQISILDGGNARYSSRTLQQDCLRRTFWLSYFPSSATVNEIKSLWFCEPYILPVNCRDLCPLVS